MNNIIGIVFKKGGKIYFFSAAGNDVKEHDLVVVETLNGLNVVEVVATNVVISNSSNIKPIVRLASKSDIKSYENNKKDSEKALIKAREIANKNKLNMNIIDASFNLDRSQLLFMFLSDVRVDFRDMAKELASVYKTRIELRQIGARDKAREVCGIGQCGSVLCCSRFLSDTMDAVSINMAKNQNLSLNPSKINGQCGRLLCCLKYEDDVYTENRSILPQVGDIINTKEGKGEVVSLNVLKKSYTIKLSDDNYVEISVDK